MSNFLVNGIPFGHATLTLDGGFAVRLINKTGAPSVKGMVVDAGSVDSSFSLTGTDDFDAFGVVYEDDIPDGHLCWVVVAGRVQVKLENNVAATRGNWVRTSTTAAGRADATASEPPGSNVSHFAELGHCLQTVPGSPGGSLCWIILHFN